MDTHLLSINQSCTCEADHVCQSCQGQDERLRATNAKLLAALEVTLEFCTMEGTPSDERAEDVERVIRAAIAAAKGTND